MKYQNKLQFLFLLLALTIFTGQEFIHPFFHAYKKSHSCYSHSHKEQKIELSTEVQHAENIKQRCPICNSIANKSIQAANIQSELIKPSSLNYSQSCESFSFSPYIKPVSRGPPSM